MERKKGFAFTMDALLATVILAVAITGAYFLTSSAEKNPAGEFLLKKQAGDILAAMDKGGELASMNSTVMDSSIAALRSPQMGWNLTVDYYSYSGGGFARNSTISLGNSSAGAARRVYAEREFLVMQNGTAYRYGNAKLSLWTG